MRNKLILSIAAVAVMSSSAFAGSLSGLSNLPEVNASKEWALEQNAPNVDVNMSDLNYTPTNIPYQTLTNPVLNITFSGAAAVVANSNASKIYVCQTDANGKPVSGVGAILKYDSTYKNIMIFKAINKDKYMTNGKHYGFFYDVNESNCSQSLTTGASLNVPAGTTQVELNKEDLQPVSAKFVLATGDSQEEQDTAVLSGNLVGVVKQFCSGISSVFGKFIDPRTGFVAFSSSAANCLTGQCSNTLNTSDSVTVNILSDACGDLNNANYMVGKATGNIIIKADKALPLKLDDQGKVSLGTAYNVEWLDDNLTKNPNEDYNVSDNKTFTIPYQFINTNTPSDMNKTMTLTVNLNGTDQIPVTKFTANVDLTTADANAANYTETLLSDADAGSWAYKAASATIPYVVASGDTQTAIRVVNPSSVDGTVYWTCTDDNGTTVSNIQVNAATADSDTVKAGGAEAWLARDILAAAQAQNPDFAPDGKMTCTVTLTNGNNGIQVVPIMTINGSRDRVIPVSND